MHTVRLKYKHRGDGVFEVAWCSEDSDSRVVNEMLSHFWADAEGTMSLRSGFHVPEGYVVIIEQKEATVATG